MTVSLTAHSTRTSMSLMKPRLKSGLLALDSILTFQSYYDDKDDGELEQLFGADEHTDSR